MGPISTSKIAAQQNLDQLNCRPHRISCAIIVWIDPELICLIWSGAMKAFLIATFWPIGLARFGSVSWLSIGKSAVNKGGVAMGIISLPLSLSLCLPADNWKSILEAPWPRCKPVVVVVVAVAHESFLFCALLLCFVRCFWKVTKLCTHTAIYS